MSELHYKAFAPGDVAARSSLFLECFPEHRDTQQAGAAYYRWKYHDPRPFGRPLEFAAYSSSGELAGYYGALPYLYRYGGRDLTAAVACDAMTAPKYRRRGVFAGLVKHAVTELPAAGCDFSIAYPIRPASTGGHLKAGWKAVFGLPIYGRLISFEQLCRDRQIRLPARALEPLLQLWPRVTGLARQMRPPEAGLRIETRPAGDLSAIDGLEAFLQEGPPDVPAYLKKSSAFLQWRLGAPGTVYRVHVLWNKQKICGYGITRLAQIAGISCCALLDYYVLPEARGHSPRLLDWIAALAKEEGAALLVTMIAPRWFRRFRFPAAGFLRTPYRFTVVVHDYSNPLNDAFFHPANWHLMWIDSDDL